MNKTNYNLFIKSKNLMEEFSRLMREGPFIRLERAKLYRADYIYIYPLTFILMLFIALGLGIYNVLKYSGLIKLFKWLSEEVKQ